MPAPTPAREFFDRITRAQDPVAAIRKLIDPENNPTFETDWLDFKREHPDPKQRDKDNRACWSEYLSAFANTGGGVLLWGIDARRVKVDGRERDCASAGVPVSDPTGLASKLNEWQGQATDPALSGVEIKPFAIPGQPPTGFVVCFVPEGPHKPYQSAQTADKQFYQRGGSNSFVMPRSVLASMFYPRSKPLFRASAFVRWQPDAAGGPLGGLPGGQVTIVLTLTNTGAATARDIFIRLAIEGVVPPVAFGGLGKGQKEQNGPPVWGFRVLAPLHPAMSHDVIAGDWLIHGNQRTRFGFEPWPIPQLLLTVYCENQERQTLPLAFSLERLLLEERLTADSAAGG